jgi:FG-GAP repeat/Glucodextranase, domain B
MMLYSAAVPVARRLYLLLALVLALAPSGCGKKAGQVILCGGPEVPTDTPPAPMVGDFPRITAQAQLPIAGWRFPDTSLEIDGIEAIPAGCERYWTTTVDLPADGDYAFTLVSVTERDDRSGPTTLTVTRDSAAPAAPALAAPADGSSTAAGTVTVTGTRELGAEVRLNGRPLVAADAPDPFTADVALGAGDNVLSLTAVDAAGNVSPAATVTVTRTSAVTTVPRPVYPLARQAVPSVAFGMPQPLAFFWAGVLDATVARFRVQVADNAGFDPSQGPLIYDQTTTNAVTLTLVPPDLPDGKYWWRVGSEDAGGTVTFGRSVPFTVGAVPSDVNGDGFADVLAGVPGWDGGRDLRTQDNRGRVHLYYGGTAFGTTPGETPAVLYDGPNTGGEFGIAVTAGDLNGDGFADVIVGAHRDDTVARDAGRAYVYLGGTTPHTDPDLILDGQNFGDGFGEKVVSGFDLNADGFDDLAVSAWLHDGVTDNTADDRGRVYVFFGGDPPDGVPDLILDGGEPLENFGVGIAGNADFNGDGYTDLAIGGPIADAGAIVDAGRVVVYYGGPWTDAVADLVLTGLAANEHLGSSVTGAGDMDADGFDDLAVGSPTYAIGGDPSRGRVHVFRGGTSPATAPALTIDGAGGCEAFGITLSGGRDLNGDGFSDIAVGAPFSDLATGNANFCANTIGDYGTVEIHFGAAVLNAAPDARITGEAANDWLGIGLHVTADTNGDRLPEVVMGAPNNDEGSNLFGDVGRGYVLFGRTGTSPWGAQRSAGTINSDAAAPGAVLTNTIGKDGLGGAVW